MGITKTVFLRAFQVRLCAIDGNNGLDAKLVQRLKGRIALRFGSAVEPGRDAEYVMQPIDFDLFRAGFCGFLSQKLLPDKYGGYYQCKDGNYADWAHQTQRSPCHELRIKPIMRL